MKHIIFQILLMFIAISSYAQTNRLVILDLCARNLEIDKENLASAIHMAEVAGIPYTVTENVELATAFPFILITSSLRDETLLAEETQSLKDFVNAGGILIAPFIKSTFYFDLFGINSTKRDITRYWMSWDSISQHPEMYWVNEELEKKLPMADSEYFRSITTRGYTPLLATVLANFEDNLAAITVNNYGNGKAYALGFELKDIVLRNLLNRDFNAHRTYSNGFEPTTDMFLLFLRAVYTSNRTVSVYKHTSPGNSTSALLITHDVDSKTGVDSMFYFSEWEANNGIKAHYFVTTHYFRDNWMGDFYQPAAFPKLLSVLENGHSIGSHSVGHFPDFADKNLFPLGSTGNTQESYRPAYIGGVSSGGTVIGELEVSRSLLINDIGANVKSFRAGHLAFNSLLIDGMSELGYAFNSTNSANDVLTNFPYRQRTRKAFSGIPTEVYEIPMTISDASSTFPITETTVNVAVGNWLNVLSKNDDNNAPTILLIHPNRGWKLGALQQLMANKPASVITYEFNAFGDYWLERRDLDFDYSLADDTLRIQFVNDNPISEDQSFVISNGRNLKSIDLRNLSGDSLAFQSGVWKENDLIISRIGNTSNAIQTASVSTLNVSDVTGLTAIGHGSITDIGSAYPTQHGMCWSTSINPTINDSHSNEGIVSEIGVFSSSLNSLSSGTTYYVRAYATNIAGTSYGEEDSFTTLYTLYTWTGNSSNDWSTASNWYPEMVPVSQDILIPASLKNYPIINSTTDASSGSLSIETDASLTIQSDEISSGSFIFEGSFTGPGKVIYQRYMAGNQWHMLGSPLAGQTISGFLTDEPNAVLIDEGNYSMKHYIENPDSWSVNYTSEIPGDIELGKAYALKRASDGMISFAGAPDNTLQSISIMRDDNGWNLLSNPFTSSISANIVADAKNNLLSVNTAALDENYVALYIWDEDPLGQANSNNYKIINQIGGELNQHYLQVGQGFFVKSAIGGGDFSISPAMQSHQTAIPFKLDGSTWTSIILNAVSDNSSASTRILYNKSMSRDLDIGYDAGLLNSYPAFSLYSRLLVDQGVNFALQCLPEEFEQLVVPVGLDAKAGELISFTASSENLSEEYVVVLEDRIKNTSTNLSEDGAEYRIQLLNEISGPGRFFIRTVLHSTLDIGDVGNEKIFQVFPRPENSKILIQGKANANTSVRVFSIAGIELLTTTLINGKENQIPFNEETGVYIIQIRDKQYTFTQKFTWVNY